MKIVVVSDWFAEKMGYSENVLPKFLAKLDAEVHVVTSDLQPAFANYQEIYEPFIGPRLQPSGIKQIDGFTLHRLPHGSQRHGIYLKGFHQTIAKIRPDIVQCFTIPSFCTYQAALSKLLVGYKLFLEEHIHWSVFTPPSTWKERTFFLIYRLIIGNLMTSSTERCYPIAPDVERIAVEYFGYSSKKTEICSLGVDTDMFTPPTTEEQMQQRRTLRGQLGFDDDDIICLYSGRFTSGKNPLCLAQAIDLLHTTGDTRFKALFIGAGPQLKDIQECAGCVVHPFVAWFQLPDLYRAADIGVWPKQESTSQLDAAACGLPIIISNRVEARERIDGNGLTYGEDDPQDLAHQIKSLYESETRQRMGQCGIKRMREHFSWERIAQQRMQDYEIALQPAGK